MTFWLRFFSSYIFLVFVACRTHLTLSESVWAEPGRAEERRIKRGFVLFPIKIAGKCFPFECDDNRRKSKMQFTLTDIIPLGAGVPAATTKTPMGTTTLTTSNPFHSLDFYWLLSFCHHELNEANNVCVIDDKIQLFRIFTSFYRIARCKIKCAKITRKKRTLVGYQKGKINWTEFRIEEYPILMALVFFVAFVPTSMLEWF